MRSFHSRPMRALFTFLPALLLFACDEGDPTAPPVDHEHDPATTIRIECVKLDPSGNPTMVKTSALVRDTTVVKGKPREEGILELEGGFSYSATVTLLDESKAVPADVTEDIRKEKDYHLFIYTPLRGVDETRILITDKDKDSKGIDVGLTFRVTVTAGTAAAGVLNVALRHFDSGNKSDAVFDTDINTDVPLRIL